MKKFVLLLTVSIVCAAQDYFPRGVFSDPTDYSKHLVALDERPLFVAKPDPQVECYRFTWLRSFHRPVVFRVDESKSGTATFTIKVGDGAGGHEPGKLVRTEKKPVDDTLLAKLRNSVQHGRFFELPATDRNLGADGSTWILEVIKDGRYHVVSRWSPRDGTIHRIGTLLIEFAIGGVLVPIY
jgi:hypothetical protein